MLLDTISMEWFQQYLTEKFPEDGKCSTSSVVHSTVNVCWKTLTVLGKLPHIWKWLRETKLLVNSIKSRSACLYSFYHSSWVYAIRPAYKPLILLTNRLTGLQTIQLFINHSA